MLKSLLNALFVAAVAAVLSVERQIFFVTGLKMPLLSRYWSRAAARVQKGLNAARTARNSR